jgi:hypothetical protein
VDFFSDTARTITDVPVSSSTNAWSSSGGVTTTARRSASTSRVGPRRGSASATNSETNSSMISAMRTRSSVVDSIERVVSVARRRAASRDASSVVPSARASRLADGSSPGAASPTAAASVSVRAP